MDAALARPADLLVIGGSALALAYDVLEGTRDLDALNDIDPIRAAAAEARRRTGLDIPLSRTSVACVPRHATSRLARLDVPGVQFLAVRVPERHDLALMKLGRGEQPDLDAVAALHAAHPLSLEILVERYVLEMGDVVGSRWKHDMALLSIVELLWGDSAADEVERRIGQRQG
jgi:hypothetical protein